ncbi:ABC transporter, ATP-binding protein [Eubacterium nodatum ATCC 33099]|nr:ABC transporter, ATP-binding protein [Eubacterium nodatum ATCC 33099]
METIRFSNISFRYPLAESDALKNINLSVKESEFMVLCGKSGCGKTTLLRHMKKNMMPYGNLSGDILYRGCDLAELGDRESTSEIGYVQQNPDNQLVTDKVWHELAFGLESLGCDNYTIKRRVSEMASYFDIQTWFRKDVSKLSGGQKQLLNLASIMAMQPKLLVLDEPTSQLDPIAASEFLRTIYKINRDLGTTVILSEHRLEEAFTMADRVAVMDEGKIVALDSPRRIGGFLSGRKAVGNHGISAEPEKNESKGYDNDETHDRAGFKSCDSAQNCHPMFYGLPTVTKIFHSTLKSAGCGNNLTENTLKSPLESPLTIREGRLWIKDMVEKSGRVFNSRYGKYSGLENVEEAEKRKERKYTEGDCVIDISGLWFRYDQRSQDILRDLNLKVEKGELFCILGGNGVGKSTALKAISNVVKAQRGRVRVLGKQAMLPQNPQALFTEISVEDELMEGIHYEEGSDEDKVGKVLEMLEIMEISHLRKSHPYDLSGGEQQRLALGKVLLLNPDVILLDEPTKGLDPFFKISLAGIFKKLTAKGKTLLMVSHDIEFCAQYGDKCAMFFDGNIVSQGSPKEFFSGNNFYTTAANKISREYIPEAITWEEVARWAETLM